MKPNLTKAKLKRGEAVYGCYVRHPDAGLAEVLAHYGWDYLMFDGEHSPITPRECENLARVCELTGVTSIARVPLNQPSLIGRYLDTGIQGVQVPMVNSGEDAGAAVRAAKYTPHGTRGLAAARAANYGQVQPFSFPDYVTQANAETMVVLQVETVASLENLTSIVQAHHADVIFIGPTDLSHSLGVPGDFNHPKVQRAFDHVVSTVGATDKALGVLVTSAEAAVAWKARGVRYMMVVLEALLAPAVRSFLRTAREG